MKMATAGLREFRASLADYVSADEPTAITRHGHTIGFFIPVKQNKEEEWARFEEAHARVRRFIEPTGITEDEIIAESLAAKKRIRQSER